MSARCLHLAAILLVCSLVAAPVPPTVAPAVAAPPSVTPRIGWHLVNGRWLKASGSCEWSELVSVKVSGDTLAARVDLSERAAALLSGGRRVAIEIGAAQDLYDVTAGDLRPVEQRRRLEPSLALLELPDAARPEPPDRASLRPVMLVVRPGAFRVVARGMLNGTPLNISFMLGDDRGFAVGAPAGQAAVAQGAAGGPAARGQAEGGQAAAGGAAARAQAGGQAVGGQAAGGAAAGGQAAVGEAAADGAAARGQGGGQAVVGPAAGGGVAAGGFAPGGEGGRVRLIVSAIGDPQSPANCALAADSFAQLVEQHPAEARKYLSPLLRRIGGDDPFAPGPADVYAAFPDIDPPAAAQQNLAAVLPRLSDPDPAIRQRAFDELRSLGPDLACAATRWPAADLNPQQRLSIEQYLRSQSRRHDQSPAELRNDRLFLIDCLEFPDARVRSSAKTELQRLLSRPIDLDPTQPDSCLTLAAKLRAEAADSSESHRR